jgi:hypothetical protein
MLVFAYISLFTQTFLSEATSIPMFRKHHSLHPFSVAGGKETASFEEHGTFEENYLYDTMLGIHL